MRVVKGIKNLGKIPSGSVITIGNFDGVHLGHQKLIRAAIDHARAEKTQCIVMTFDPHPLKLLFPERGIKQIFPHLDQHRQMENLGVDVLVVEPFSRELSELSADEFIRTRVQEPVRPSWVVVGYDFAFGRGRQGNPEYLKKNSSSWGFKVEVVPAFQVGGVICSSSEIRKRVSSGDVAGAAGFLGRNFHIDGIVEKGAGRGGKIGFPTANIATSAELIPKPGVYVTRVNVAGKDYLAATNVGYNPTFDDEDPDKIKIESHLIGFSGNLYGERLVVEFLQFLRDEKKFSGVDALVEQIKKDVDQVAKWKSAGPV